MLINLRSASLKRGHYLNAKFKKLKHCFVEIPINIIESDKMCPAFLLGSFPIEKVMQFSRVVKF